MNDPFGSRYATEAKCAPAPKPHSYMAWVKASGILLTLEELLAEGKLGRLSDEHDLALLVSKLRMSVGGALPTDGETHWAELVKSTRHERPSRKKSSKMTLECGKQFRDWLKQTFLSGPRMVVDLDGGSVVLDGQLYVNFKSLDALKMLKVMNDRLGEAIKGKTIYRLACGTRPHDNSFSRTKDELCEPFRSFIRSKNGVGQWLELPPLIPS